MSAKNGVFSPNTKTDQVKIAYGQVTTTSANHSIDTGLKEIYAIVVSLDGAPDSNTGAVSAAVPASGGTFVLKSFDTAASSPFNPAASSFGAKVNYIAVGR